MYLMYYVDAKGKRVYTLEVSLAFAIRTCKQMAVRAYFRPNATLRASLLPTAELASYGETTLGILAELRMAF